ncbi:hypothetical protein BS78_05G053900 [Paspalum vaginatum]|nr:hypothetical protein BS78_05G053900 [Paspalum vaginatum]
MVRKRVKKRPGHSSVDQLGHFGLILLLFETPSGFAIFKFDGVRLYLPNAMEMRSCLFLLCSTDSVWTFFVRDCMARDVIWLKQFKTCKNKATVFNHTGVNKELAEMIHRWHEPGQLLAVGNPEHKKIIESKLKIPCLYNEIVMEVMWGIKRLMKSLVPCEDSPVSKEDQLQMSVGMDKILRRHGIVVTPEMVNEQIIEHACILYDSELCETKHSKFLATCGEHLEEISCIDCKGWSPMKLATALMILSIPEEDIPSDPELDYSGEEVSKLKNDGFKYDGALLKNTCVRIYSEMVWAREVLAETVKKLKLWTTETNEASEERPGATMKQETKLY